jgi:hypothetical protein
LKSMKSQKLMNFGDPIHFSLNLSSNIAGDIILFLLFIFFVFNFINRGARERQFLRDLLQPLIKLILSDTTLDLETDPIFVNTSPLAPMKLIFTKTAPLIIYRSIKI